jgi:hypothetical protein
MNSDEKIEKIERLIQKYESMFPSPVLQVQYDIAFYEAIFDILVVKGITTQKEITHYLDMYKQIWTTLANLLIDKGVTTAKELNCSTLAYHHFVRIEGTNSNKTPEELFEARQKYTKELMNMKDPLEMIGK